MKLIIPKLHKDYISSDDTYQMIIEDIYNQEHYLYTVIDLKPDNKLRYLFDIKFNLKGNYKYYLITNDEWEYDYLDYDNIYKSTYNDNDFNLTSLQSNGLLLVQGNILLVTSCFLGTIKNLDDNCTTTSLIVNQSEPNEPTRDIKYKYKCMNVITTGLFNIESEEEEEIIYKEKNTYVTYEG